MCTAIQQYTSERWLIRYDPRTRSCFERLFDRDKRRGFCAYVLFIIIIFFFCFPVTDNTRGAHRIAAHNEKEKREPAAPDSPVLRRERVQVSL